jgi:outer membrane protein assembly factor BamB
VPVEELEMTRLRVLCQSALVLLIAMAASAAEYQPAPGDWPGFRGPNRDGISKETGLNHTWSEDGPPLLWTTTGLGGGFSSVSIAGDKIFTMGDHEDGQYVMALKLEDGDELWKTRIGDAWKESYLGPRCTPTYDGELLYAIGTHGDLACLETATGKTRWHKSFKKDFGGKMMSGWGFSESPLVDGDKVLCTPGAADAMIVALDKKTGDVIWKSAVPSIGENGKDGAAYASIVISNGAGTKQYVQLTGRGVIGVSANDGKFLWGYNKIANKTANIPTPIIHDDYVFCSTGYQTGAALLKLNRTSDGVEAEEIYFLNSKTLQNHHGGMIMVGDYLYGGTGHNLGFPVCVEWLTGKVVWNGGRGPGSGSAAVVYADGSTYFRYQNGVIAEVEATPLGYNLLGKFELPAGEKPSWPYPVVAGGKLYLREQDNLYCYQLKP